MTYNVVEYWDNRGNITKGGSLSDKEQDFIFEYVYGKEKLLDFGCGKGRLFNLYQTNREVYGYDITTNHSDHLRAMSAKYRLDFKFVKGELDYEVLPFRDQFFDVCICSEVLLHQYPNQVGKIMNELARVSKKVACITALYREDQIPASHCFDHNYIDICDIYKLKLLNYQIYNNRILFAYTK